LHEFRHIAVIRPFIGGKTVHRRDEVFVAETGQARRWRSTLKIRLMAWLALGNTRPKGTKRLATILNEAMQQKLEIQEKGRTRQISVWEAVVKTLRNNALKGDFKAIAFLLAQEPEIARTTEPIPKISADMSAQEAMNVYLRFMKESTGSRA
jgi:hypothetical protein